MSALPPFPPLTLSEARSYEGPLSGLARIFAENADVTAPMLVEAAALQRWANAGRLIASAAHELRGALTAAQVNLEYLSAELKRPQPATAVPELSEAIQDARTGISRALDAAAQVAALAAIRPAGIVAVSVRDAVDAAVAAIAPRLRGLVAIEIEDAGVGPVRAEPGTLHQSLVSLLLNAADAAGEERGRGTVRVSIASRGGWVRVAVADDGPRLPTGMTGESSRSRGSGLGLSLSAALVRAFAGSLQCGQIGPLGGSEYALLLHPAGDAT